MIGVGEGVLIEMEVHGLPLNSWVAVHVHETGDCDPNTAYEFAREHFNPTGAEHGYRSERGPHVGDLPNQYVDEKGFLRAQTFSNFLTLGGGEPDVRGKALIVHAEPDDYETQPSGHAGDRIACAVIE